MIYGYLVRLHIYRYTVRCAYKHVDVRIHGHTGVELEGRVGTAPANSPPLLDVMGVKCLLAASQ